MTTLERPVVVDEPIDTSALEQVWEDTPGLAGFVTSVDHKKLGIRYMVTALTFLLIGGIEALLIRSQLFGPRSDLLSPEAYNQLMSMHGTTMILLFNTPMFAAFGNYLLPLQLGARDMAFPRLNALSYWIFLLAGGFMYASFLVGKAPDGGWFSYTPLTSTEYSPGINLDFWAIGVTFLGISTTVGGINFIVTTFKLRAPGMSFNRLPLFVWGILAMSFMIVFALPAITLAGALLELDRAMGMNWFNPAAGGDPVLYQHFFWIWGHPEVYIVFIPATGIVSMVIATFTRREIAGYRLVVAAVVATSFISFGLWVHHMFAVGLPFLVASFFSAASMLVAIPSGVQMFAWVTTIAGSRGRPRFEPPMLWAIGFIVVFLIGGITGVMVAVVPFDLQVTDSYFVVAHFHYVLIGGSVFPHLRRAALLAPQAHWPPLQPKGGHHRVLAGVHRDEPDLLRPALPRPGGHASAGLHLRRRPRVDGAEPHLDRRRLRAGGGVRAGARQPPGVALPRPAGRQRPVGGRDPRVVHHLPAPALQLRHPPHRAQHRTDVGRQGRRRAAHRPGGGRRRPHHPPPRPPPHGGHVGARRQSGGGGGDGLAERVAPRRRAVRTRLQREPGGAVMVPGRRLHRHGHRRHHRLARLART